MKNAKFHSLGIPLGNKDADIYFLRNKPAENFITDKENPLSRMAPPLIGWNKNPCIRLCKNISRYLLQSGLNYMHALVDEFSKYRNLHRALYMFAWFNRIVDLSQHGSKMFVRKQILQMFRLP